MKSEGNTARARRLKTLHVHRATKKDFRAGVPVNSCSSFYAKDCTIPGAAKMSVIECRRTFRKNLGIALSDSTKQPLALIALTVTALTANNSAISAISANGYITANTNASANSADQRY